MLSKLQLYLATDSLSYFKSSNMQGILMENIHPDYAAYLHQQQMHPYSQAIIKSGEDIVWTVNGLNKEAYENIILPLKDNLQEIVFRKSQNDPVKILRKELIIQSKKDLFTEFNEVAANRYIKVTFVTPTAFKQDGKYLILPDLKNIYQNLMMRYSASSDNYDMADEDTLSQLVQESFITDLRIRSRRQPMERVNIPGFVGDVTVKCAGSNTMARYIRLLMKFGEYAGVGIKTAVGMGAMKINGEQEYHE